MFRYQKLVLKNCPPVGNLVAELDERLTVIVGANGSGKTAVYAALRNGCWPHGGSVELTTHGYRADLFGVEALVFVDDDSLSRDWPHGLSPRVAAEVLNPAFWKRFGCLIADDLRRDPDNFRYRGTPYRGAESFDVRVMQDWEVMVRAKVASAASLTTVNAPVFDSRSAAMGERIFLRIAAILAMREHMGLDAPLIVDDLFGNLDESWSAMVIGLVKRHARQLILVCSTSVWAKISRYCETACVIHL